MHLDKEIEFNLKLSEVYDDDDDVDMEFQCTIGDTMMTHTSNVSHAQPTPLDAANLSHESLNRSIHPENGMQEADWSIQLAQAHQVDLNLKCNYISFPQTQQQMMNQPNSFMSKSESHLDDVSGSEFDFPNASPNSDTDEPLISTRRRINAIIVDDSDEEMYDGYIIANIREVSLDSITSLVNLSPTPTKTLPATISEGDTKDLAIVDGIPLSHLGQKNRVKLLATGQYPNGPKPKKCRICGQDMDWKTTGTLSSSKNGKGDLVYYYTTAHSGTCVSEAYNARNNARNNPINNAKVNTPTSLPTLPNDMSPPTTASLTHLLQFGEDIEENLGLDFFLLTLGKRKS
jgi:hypothetical protein